MKIIINGEEKTLEAPLNLYDVLVQEDVIGMMIAVARNGEFVPKENYQSVSISEGDQIEIVAPMQGG